MQQSTLRILIRFLGSINFAITLLVAIAIAAVIDTVIQQNQPYPDYLLKLSPFWFELFRTLDLFNAYGSVWSLSILGFLVLCVYRHAPRILQISLIIGKARIVNGNTVRNLYDFDPEFRRLAFYCDTPSTGMPTIFSLWYRH